MADLAFDIGKVKITNIENPVESRRRSEIVDSFDALRLLPCLTKVPRDAARDINLIQLLQTS